MKKQILITMYRRELYTIFQRHTILVRFFVDFCRAEALESLIELYTDQKANQVLNPVFYMIIFTTRFLYDHFYDQVSIWSFLRPGYLLEGLSTWLYAGRSLMLLSTAKPDLHAELQRNLSQTGAHMAVLDLREKKRRGLSTLIVDIFSSVVSHFCSVAIHLVCH